MCGIAGFLETAPTTHDQRCAMLERMGASLAHRGPDSSGSWTDDACGVGLAHRRLAVIDLSSSGHQPMESPDGRYVLVLNGEIYNFLELRAELARRGHAFRGTSDTEVLLAAIVEWGLANALSRANGMWALALWDRRLRTLALSRDRLGEKPLFYGWCGRTLLFGSELEALRVHPEFRAELSRPALASYLRYMYVPGPQSIYEGISKLPPATILTIDATVESGDRSARPEPYWSAHQAALSGLERPFDGTPDEAVDALDGLLLDAVRLRMSADVPLGAFLSGGIDSSLIVAMMAQLSGRPVKTFTIGFAASPVEIEGARAVARHLHTDHTEIIVGPEQALAVVPRLPRLYDEPFADSSQIPTLLIAEATRRHVTVSLSGDGGDELFAGYDRLIWGLRVWSRLGRLPLPLRRGLSRAIGAVPARVVDAVAAAVSRRLPPRRRMPDLTGKLQKLAALLPLADGDAVYHDLISSWKAPQALLGPVEERPNPATDPGACAGLTSFSDRMLHRDLVMSLPDDMLQKIDRATMGVALETRVPLLDHRLVEFAWRLPFALKLREGRGKWVLRQVLYRRVPRELVDRPKHGFGVPIVDWLRGPMRPWAEDLLSERRLRADGLLAPAPIRAAWSEHLAGRRNHQARLWIVLMLQLWLEQSRRRGVA